MSSEGDLSEVEEMKSLNKKIVNSLLNLAVGPAPGPIDDNVTYFDIFWTFISIIGRVISVLLNINLAMTYYANGKQEYFIWTSLCILIPASITVLMSCTMFIKDYKAKQSKAEKGVIEILCFVLVFPYIFRYCQSLRFAIMSKRAELKGNQEDKKKYFEYLLEEDSDVALIRIFECFLEAAPMKILQLTIVLSGEEPLDLPQLLTIINSIFSMTWSMASYYRCIRFTQPEKHQISWIGTGLQCVWHFTVTLSRIISISIIATVFPVYTLIAVGIHAFFMTLWNFLIDRSPFCSRMFFSFIFSMLLGAVYVFTYILPKDGPSFKRYFAFYIICGLENLGCAILFCMYTDQPNNYIWILTSLSTFPFALGIIVMLTYYKWFHPNITSRRFELSDL